MDENQAAQAAQEPPVAVDETLAAEAEVSAQEAPQFGAENAAESPGESPEAEFAPPEFGQDDAAHSNPSAQAASMSGGGVNLDMLLDVPITLSMEVGRTRVPIRNLMQLNPGSVVELDRLAGQPLDVYVNGTLIAHGEVVVVNEKFGVRLIDVVSPAERIRRLRS